MRVRSSAGLGHVEVTVAVAIIVPLLIAVFSTSNIVRGSLSANETAAGIGTTLRVTFDRVRQLMRPAYVGTMLTRANATDVSRAEAELAEEQAAAAAKGVPLLDPPYVPALGEWYASKDFMDRRSLKFRAALGVLNINATSATGTRFLDFVQEDGELANGADDDGDGLVDEGRLVLVYDDTTVVLAEGLEVCRFDLVGSCLKLRLQCVRRDGSGRLHRQSAERTFYLRNN